MAGNARRCASVTVKTIYGETECFGKDDRGQVLVMLRYGVAPELEPAVPEKVRGKYY